MRGSPSGAEDVPLRPLDRGVRVLWTVAAGVRVVVAGAFAALAEAQGWAAPLLEALVPWAVPTWGLTASVVGVGITLAAVVPGLRYRRWRYALRDSDLWIRKGILVHRVSVIPYRRLQFVDTRQGPLERWMGLTQLVVHTAAPGTSGLIPGLATAEAERLREVLARFEPGDGDLDDPNPDAAAP
jgi:uncharacterized protein